VLGAGRKGNLRIPAEIMENLRASQQPFVADASGSFQTASETP